MSIFNNIQIEFFIAQWDIIVPFVENHPWDRDRFYWRFRRQRDNFWRLYLHEDDGVTITCGGKCTALRKHGLYLIPAGTEFDADVAQPARQFYVHFDLVGLSNLAMQELFHELIIVPPDRGLERRALAFAKQHAAYPTFELTVECGIKAILFAALTMYLDAIPPERINRYQQMAKTLAPVLPAITYMEHQYGEPIPIALLAELCGYTPEHFIRRFRNCTGITPVKYLQNYRVKMAAQQLAFTEHSIDDIAAATGFGSRAYFGRVFKQVTGCNPATYRRDLKTRRGLSQKEMGKR